MNNKDLQKAKIDKDKLLKVICIYNEETDPRTTPELIEQEICADWNNADEHQKWLDTATAQEIADWLASFLLQLD